MWCALLRIRKNKRTGAIGVTAILTAEPEGVRFHHKHFCSAENHDVVLRVAKTGS